MKTLKLSLVLIGLIAWLVCFAPAQTKQKQIDSLKYEIQKLQQRIIYFGDLEIIETVTRNKMTIQEVAEMIDKLPNVKRISYPCEPVRRFNIERLAYPQYQDEYELTQDEWIMLKRYCIKQLNECGYAHPDVIKHWRSISGGTPPFGLRVQGAKSN